MREKIDPYNWELRLGNGKFIDDSGATTNPTVNEGGRVFNIVSGSLETGVGAINTVDDHNKVVELDYFIQI